MVAEFCARCGEQQPAHRDLSIRSVAYDAAQNLMGADGGVPRTLWMADPDVRDVLFDTTL